MKHPRHDALIDEVLKAAYLVDNDDRGYSLHITPPRPDLFSKEARSVDHPDAQWYVRLARRTDGGNRPSVYSVLVHEYNGHGLAEVLSDMRSVFLHAAYWNKAKVRTEAEARIAEAQAQMSQRTDEAIAKGETFPPVAPTAPIDWKKVAGEELAKDDEAAYRLAVGNHMAMRATIQTGIDPDDGHRLSRREKGIWRKRADRLAKKLKPIQEARHAASSSRDAKAEDAKEKFCAAVNATDAERDARVNELLGSLSPAHRDLLTGGQDFTSGAVVVPAHKQGGLKAPSVVAGEQLVQAARNLKRAATNLTAKKTLAPQPAAGATKAFALDPRGRKR